MIPQTIATWQTSCWKEELRDAITDPLELLARLDISEVELKAPLLHTSNFPMRVPESFVRRMIPGDANDPLLLQVLPTERELTSGPGFTRDPLQEKDYNPIPGIIHKYNGRVLMVTTPVCAVNCRYCFRRHFPYGENNPGKRNWLNSLDYIANDQTISEVILSGGDPLATDDQHLQWLVSEIEKIDHVKRLRVHTRLPVVIPGRIDEKLLDWVTATRLTTVFVLHINHPNEINQDLVSALAQLRKEGIQLLNQSVLLSGVNDHYEVFVTLSEKLFESGILPYYLHLLDPVEGAEHFDVPLARAIEIHDGMRAQLPGYLLPRLVRDVPGRVSKMHISTQNH